MITNTEYLREEEVKSARRLAYERVLNEVNFLERQIARLTPIVEEFDKEIEVLQKVAVMARTLSKKTVGEGGFLARDQIISNVSAACSFNESRRDKVKADIEKYRKSLDKLRPKLAEFTAPTP